jgi:hypothetical protein
MYEQPTPSHCHGHGAPATSPCTTCGLPRQLQVSHSAANPNRGFYSCRPYQDAKRGRPFVWADALPPAAPTASPADADAVLPTPPPLPVTSQHAVLPTPPVASQPDLERPTTSPCATCGLPRHLQVSHSAANPDRGFYSCRPCQDAKRGRPFEWADTMPQSATITPAPALPAVAAVAAFALKPGDTGTEFIVGGTCTICNASISNWKVKETHLAGSRHHAALVLQRRAEAGNVAQLLARGDSAAAALPTRPCPKCRKPRVPQTSGPNAKNPNRTFYTCNGCNAFEWADQVGVAKASVLSVAGAALGTVYLTATCKLQPGKKVRKIARLTLSPAAQNGAVIAKAVVDFKYNAVVQSTLKLLHPGTRSYCPADKFWLVDAAALPSFAAALEADDDVEKFDGDIRAVEAFAAALAARDGEHLSGAADRKKRARADFAPAASCDCGRPWEQTNGGHTCRFYGVFRCGCGSTWSSGWVWRVGGAFEQQDCRRCDAANAPAETRQRDRAPPRDAAGGGGHDVGHCHMCRQLGHPCNE